MKEDRYSHWTEGKHVAQSWSVGIVPNLLVPVTQLPPGVSDC